MEVASLLVDEGDYVTVGTPVFLMTTKTAEDLIETYSDAMENAEEKVESAQSSLDNTQDTYDDYTITAPISGQVITKSYKVGDNISRLSLIHIWQRRGSRPMNLKKRGQNQCIF